MPLWPSREPLFAGMAGGADLGAGWRQGTALRVGRSAILGHFGCRGRCPRGAVQILLFEPVEASFDALDLAVVFEAEAESLRLGVMDVAGFHDLLEVTATFCALRPNEARIRAHSRSPRVGSAVGEI